MKIVIEHVYHCEPAVFWEKRFDPEHRKRRELEGCGALEFQVVEDQRDGEVWRQVVEVVEQVDAPKAVRKVFGETTRITEEITWTRGTDTASLVFRPDRMAKKVSVSAELRVVDLSDGTCHAKAVVDVQVKIFAVGGIVEKLLAKSVPPRFERDVAWFNANEV